jgi:hypothetical protein
MIVPASSWLVRPNAYSTEKASALRPEWDADQCRIRLAALNSLDGGRSGPTHFCITDWDGDGQLDLLVNSNPNVNFLRSPGRDAEGRYAFKDEGPVSAHFLPDTPQTDNDRSARQRSPRPAHRCGRRLSLFPEIPPQKNKSLHMSSIPFLAKAFSRRYGCRQMNGNLLVAELARNLEFLKGCNIHGVLHWVARASFRSLTSTAQGRAGNCGRARCAVAGHREHQRHPAPRGGRARQVRPPAGVARGGHHDSRILSVLTGRRAGSFSPRGGQFRPADLPLQLPRTHGHAHQP